jgi:hypothetical protein
MKDSNVLESYGIWDYYLSIILINWFKNNSILKNARHNKLIG